MCPQCIHTSFGSNLQFRPRGFSLSMFSSCSVSFSFSFSFSFSLSPWMQEVLSRRRLNKQSPISRLNSYRMPSRVLGVCIYIERERIENDVYITDYTFIYIYRERDIYGSVCMPLSIHALSRREPHVGRWLKLRASKLVYIQCGQLVISLVTSNGWKHPKINGKNCDGLAVSLYEFLTLPYSSLFLCLTSDNRWTVEPKSSKTSLNLSVCKQKDESKHI